MQTTFTNLMNLPALKWRQNNKTLDAAEVAESIALADRAVVLNHNGTTATGVLTAHQLVTGQKVEVYRSGTILFDVGGVGNFTISNPGSGYVVGDTVTLLDDGDGNAVFMVTSVDTGGGITGLATVNAGIGYTVNEGLLTNVVSATGDELAEMSVTGVDPATVNDIGEYFGKFTVTVIDANTFTYEMARDPHDSIRSTGAKIGWAQHAQRAIVFSPTTNADIVSIGPDIRADYKDLNPGDEFVIENPNGSKFDLADWFMNSDTDAQDLKILYV